MEKYKTCSKCLIAKSINEFHRQSRAKDGYQSQCRDCKRIGNRETMRKFRTANPEKHREINKKSRASNPAKIRKQRRERYLRNKESENLQARLYYANNPSRIKEAASLRKRRLLANGIYTILTKELNKVYSSNCFLCQSNKQIELDHIVPISKGGSHSIGNVMPLCRACNRSKSDKLLIQFIMERRGLK